MLAAVTENQHHAEFRHLAFAILEADDGATIVVMDVTVTSASTDRTGLKLRLKLSHVGIKKRF